VLLPAVAGFAVVGVLLVVAFRPAGGQGSDGNDGGSSAGTSTAVVETRNLVDRESVNGTLGYGETSQVGSPVSGTLTAVPADGTVIDRGQTLFEVDGKGVPLFFGTVPMYRELSTSADDGPDIRQLEENLVALGFATESELTVDDEYTSATASAVREWQESLGRDETGTVGVSDLVFEPAAVRVSKVTAAVGSSVGPGGPVMDVTGTTRVVTVRIEAARQDVVKVGRNARVSLPDGSTGSATIVGVGTVATKEGEEQSPHVTVTLVLDDPAASGTLDQAPVEVEFTLSREKDALAVPARALLALAEGGYAVEVVRDGGATELVAVEVGSFADGFVGVSGAVEEGDEVVVPE
jgi:peptidoglycan hydrolase-like protein with peptidoglycan-binding domain